MPDPLDLLIIYGSVRPHRQGIKAGDFSSRLASEAPGDADRPLENQLPLLKKNVQGIRAGPVRPRSSNGWPHGSARPMPSSSSAESTTIASPCSPICWITSSKSISGDHRPSFATPRVPSAAFAPCNLACAMLCELGTPSIPSLLPIPRVQDAFDEAGHPRDESYNQRAVPERGSAGRRAQNRTAGGGFLIEPWPHTSPASPSGSPASFAGGPTRRPPMPTRLIAFAPLPPEQEM